IITKFEKAQEKNSNYFIFTQKSKTACFCGLVIFFTNKKTVSVPHFFCTIFLPTVIFYFENFI
ncbi:hypothetical protein, partial [Enterococcus faecalis]|uniref:hypothetical protein n=1 Tax=Enterococcus faecalis TaxID=1351 RepID=UPI003CC56E4C